MGSAMRFPQGLYVLVLIPLALALVCSEIPESHSLADDVSNDLVVGSRAPATTVAKAAKVATDHSISKPLLPASAAPITSDRGTRFLDHITPLSGKDTLYLLSIQRK